MVALCRQIQPDTVKAVPSSRGINRAPADLQIPARRPIGKLTFMGGFFYWWNSEIERAPRAKVGVGFEVEDGGFMPSDST